MTEFRDPRTTEFVSALPNLDEGTWAMIKSVIERHRPELDFPEGRSHLIAANDMPEGIGAVRVTRRGARIVVS